MGTVVVFVYFNALLFHDLVHTPRSNKWVHQVPRLHLCALVASYSERDHTLVMDPGVWEMHSPSAILSLDFVNLIACNCLENEFCFSE